MTNYDLEKMVETSDKWIRERTGIEQRFWVEGGEIQFPVEEITIAGNLRQMFLGLRAVGNDFDYPGSTQTGSWLIDRMTIAGG
ncbi:MAG: metallopeptidase TldD-related protein [Chromatiaceae bacterium]